MPHTEDESSRAITLPSDGRIAQIQDVGIGVARYGVVFLLVVIGAAKYFAFEAEAIKPLVENSPFMSWMLGAFGVQGTSNIIGTVEIATGLAIASRRFSPSLSAIGSALAAGIFLTTLSFLFSTPGALSLKHPAGGFLLKDVVLLGAAIATCGEALRAARARSATGTEPGFGGVRMSRAAS